MSGVQEMKSGAKSATGGGRVHPVEPRHVGMDDDSMT